MTKLYSKLTLILLICIGCGSCSEDDMTSQDVNLKDINIDLSQSRIGGAITLGSNFTTTEDLVSKIESQMATVYIDTQARIASDKNITDVQLRIRVSNGTAIIDQIVDGKNNVLVSAKTYDGTGYRVDPNVGMYASCPGGYERLGSCSNLSGTADCIASAMGEFLSANLGSIGDCAYVYVSVGTFSSSVCGKVC